MVVQYKEIIFLPFHVVRDFLMITKHTPRDLGPAVCVLMEDFAGKVHGLIRKTQAPRTRPQELLFVRSFLTEI